MPILSRETKLHSHIIPVNNAYCIILSEQHAVINERIGFSLLCSTEIHTFLRERVQTGVDEQQKPIYKWATGYSAAELQLDIARILIEETLDFDYCFDCLMSSKKLYATGFFEGNLERFLIKFLIIAKKRQRG